MSESSPTGLRNAAIIEVFRAHVEPAVAIWRESEAESRTAFLEMMDVTSAAVMDYMVDTDPLGKHILKPDYKAFFEDQGIVGANNARHPFNAPFKYALFGTLAWGKAAGARTEAENTAIETAITQSSRYANVAAWALREGKKPSAVIAEHGGLQEANDFYSLSKLAGLNSTKEKQEEDEERKARLEAERAERLAKKEAADKAKEIDGELVKEKAPKLVITKQEVDKAEAEAKTQKAKADKLDKELRDAEAKRKKLAEDAERNETRRKELEKKQAELEAENAKREAEQKAENERLEAQAAAQKEAEAKAEADAKERQKEADAAAKKAAKEAAKKKEGEFKHIALPKLAPTTTKLLETVGTDLLLHVKLVDGKWMVVDPPILWDRITHSEDGPTLHSSHPEQPTAH